MAVDDLGPRGRRLWEAHKDDVAGERGLVLLEEACRTADRLEALDGVIRGKGVCGLLHLRHMHESCTDTDMQIVLTVDGALSEARQQGAALRQLVTSLPLKESGDDEDPDDWLNELPT